MLHSLSAFAEATHLGESWGDNASLLALNRPLLALLWSITETLEGAAPVRHLEGLTDVLKGMGKGLPKNPFLLLPPPPCFLGTRETEVRSHNAGLSQNPAPWQPCECGAWANTFQTSAGSLRVKP